MLSQMNSRDYPLELRPLSPADGGGWLVTFPDLPGCMADGETPEQAIQEGWDAAAAWLAVAAQYHDPIPAPSQDFESSQAITRIPKQLHHQLETCARQKGVNVNALVVELLTEDMTEYS
jgi:antitoxin HicB